MNPQHTSLNSQFDLEGYIKNVNNWDRSLALDIAVREGIPELRDDHWRLIEALRKHYFELGSVPVMRQICHDVGMQAHCVSDLLSDPKRAWRIAGLPNPGEEANTYLQTADIPDQY